MRICQMILIAGLVTSAATARVRVTPAVGCVTVQVSMKAPFSVGDLAEAEHVVKQVFGNIGVEINWHGFVSRERNASCIAVAVQFDPQSPLPKQSDVLAFALPYQSGGTQIHVLMDRLMRYEWQMRGLMLGYTLVHEIGHVLERVSRHSESGVMKAQWTGKDFCAMRKGSLEFAAEDADLIQLRFLGTQEAVLTSSQK